MNTINVSQPFSGESPASRFEAVKVLAISLAESSPFDSYEHFGHGPFINIRNSNGNKLICLTGGRGCVPLDEWTSKLT
jgi:hypothetical protein